MNRYLPLCTLLAAALLLAACETEPATEPIEDVEPADEVATEVSEWGYEGEAGPENWDEISEDYATCETGTEQSPIALQTSAAEEADLPALTFDYGQASLDIEDLGLGYKATPEGTHTLTIEDQTYELLQFHAHTPSEHTLDGESYPMEVHFVHQNDAGELAVVGVMIEDGMQNDAYAPVVEAVQGDMGADVQNLAALLPENADYFTYDGSLTTPPCSEGVRWIVMEEPISFSSEQLDAFEGIHGETNRPVQPLEGRTVRVSM